MLTPLRTVAVAALIVPVALLWGYHQRYLSDVPGFTSFFAIQAITLSNILGFYSKFTSPAPIDTDWEGKGVQSEVEILRDEYGVPHVFSNSLTDAFFAQGFLQARERAWQMDLLRLAAYGQISSVVGPSSLAMDVVMRTLGLTNRTPDANEIDADTQEILLAYVHGVQAGLTSLTHRPFEAVLTGHKIDPVWSIEDSAAIFRLISLSMNGGWTMEWADKILDLTLPVRLRELFRVVNDTFGPAVNEFSTGTALFDQNGNPIEPPSVIQAEVNAHVVNRTGAKPRRPQDIPEMAEVPDVPRGRRDSGDDPVVILPEGGSNAWVIGGEHTESGKPILCGDPHLPVTAPGFWYPIFAKAAEPFPLNTSSESFKMAGVSIPGIPGIGIGRNQHMAWSITLNLVDMEDLYLITESADAKFYLFDDEWLPFQMRQEVISVKGAPDAIITVRETVHGPVISDALPALKELCGFRQAIAYSSTALSTAWPMRWMTDIIAAKGWKDFYHASSKLASCGFSMVWASDENDKGVFFTGAIPKRESPHVVKDGTTSKALWKGGENFDVKPHIMNPPNGGYVLSANQKLTLNQKEILGRSQLPASRAYAIEKYLKEIVERTKQGGRKTTVDEMQAMQANTFGIDGVHWRDLVIRAEKNFGNYCDAENFQLVMQDMKEWDGFYIPSSRPAVIVENWISFALKHVMRHQSSRALQILQGYPVMAHFGRHNEYAVHFKVGLFKALGEGIDGASTLLNEGPDVILCLSWKAANNYLKFRLGKNYESWTWSRFITRYFEHSAAGSFPHLHDLFSVGPVARGGSDCSIFATFLGPRFYEEAEVRSGRIRKGLATVAPSMRLIVDLGNSSAGRWAVPPGVSGWHNSPHYRSHTRHFEEGTLAPMLWKENEIRKAAVTKFSLRPSEK